MSVCHLDCHIHERTPRVIGHGMYEVFDRHSRKPMKIALSTQGKDLNAAVDPRFGRCSYFIIVDSESMQFDVIENTNAAAAGGVGIQAAQLLANKDVQVVLTGNCGPNAFATLKAADISVYIGASGSVQAALEQYKQGQLQAADQPNVGGHFGGKKGKGQG